MACKEHVGSRGEDKQGPGEPGEDPQDTCRPRAKCDVLPSLSAPGPHQPASEQPQGRCQQHRPERPSWWWCCLSRCPTHPTPSQRGGAPQPLLQRDEPCWAPSLMPVPELRKCLRHRPGAGTRAPLPRCVAPQPSWWRTVTPSTPTGTGVHGDRGKVRAQLAPHPATWLLAGSPLVSRCAKGPAPGVAPPA